MSEGLSAVDVSNDLHAHATHGNQALGRHGRAVQIAEATLLALVTIITAYAGFAAARWSTESRVRLASASTLRAEAGREDLRALELRNFDSSTFEAWFSANLLGDQDDIALAIRRFRLEFKVAFDAWQATDPQHNPLAPPGPTYMPQYRQPEKERADDLDRQATATFESGQRAGAIADRYVRVTVLLAAVLFLIGIGTTFTIARVRLGLIGVGVVLLVAALVFIVQQPAPPR